jgi:hypothetical protein
MIRDAYDNELTIGDTIIFIERTSPISLTIGKIQNIVSGQLMTRLVVLTIDQILVTDIRPDHAFKLLEEQFIFQKLQR